MACDEISANRPGARRETLEQFLKRMEQLEEIATRFEGVDKAYAIQAGREIRVIVEPTAIDDTKAKEMAREIAKEIQLNVEFPGQIKVTVIREYRAYNFAT
jgi:ribonuclease Y